MRKGESQKAQRDKLQKIGELALRAFFNSFPYRRRRNFKNPTFEVIIASGKEMAALSGRRPPGDEPRPWAGASPKGRASLKKNDKKVDVLAFREPEDFPLPPSLKIKNNLGEIYLNWDLKPRDFERFTFLFLHGLHHLLGFSHEKERDMMEMEKIEKKIWRQICFWV